MTTDTKYSTSDTSLAAYLHTEGFELLFVECPDGIRSFFVFVNDNPMLYEHVRKFELGQAEGNINVYINNYRRFVRKAHDAKRIA